MRSRLPVGSYSLALVSSRLSLKVPLMTPAFGRALLDRIAQVEEAHNSRSTNGESKRNVDRHLTVLIGLKTLFVVFELRFFVSSGFEDFDIPDFAFFRHRASFPSMENEA
jgi:hypothetical protein